MDALKKTFVMLLVIVLTGTVLLAEQRAADKISAAKGKMVNINTASITELTALPRIGPKIAERIVEFRKTNGNFRKIQDLMKVKGIGEKMFEALKNQITV